MKKTISRRGFMEATAATSLAFQFLPSRVFGANERVHVAGIGVGGKGRRDQRRGQGRRRDCCTL